MLGFLCIAAGIGLGAEGAEDLQTGISTGSPHEYRPYKLLRVS